MTKECFNSLDDVASHVWQNLAAAVANRDHPWRIPAVATSDASGLPHVRTVVLRSVGEAPPTLEFHTDARSPKQSELAASPTVAWLFYDQSRKIQLRIDSKAELHCGNEIARERWDSLNVGCRRTYCYPKGPGTPAQVAVPELSEEWRTGRPRLDQTEWAFSHFTIVRCEVKRWDWLFLRAAGHQRAQCLYTEDGAELNWLLP